MSIDLQLYLLSGGLAGGGAIAAWQSFRRRKIYRSTSAFIGMVTFVLLGTRQVYSILRLRSSIAQARTRGTMIEHLSIEQWIVGVLWGYLIIVGFVLWQHWQHLEIKRLTL